MPSLRMTVSKCTHCGKEHELISLVRLAAPTDKATHKATCPVTGKDIYAKFRMCQHESCGRLASYSAIYGDKFESVDGCGDHIYGLVPDLPKGTPVEIEPYFDMHDMEETEDGVFA